MSRGTMTFDRFATLLTSLLLLAGSAAGVWWWTGDSPFLERSQTGLIQDQVANGWWPWASGAAGVVLVLIGLRWIAAHLKFSTVKQLSLNGSGSSGKLVADAGKVAGAAASAFTDTLGVRKAKAHVGRDRGRIVVQINATIEPEADLRVIAEHADVVAAQLGQVLDRKDLRCRVQLTVARSGRTLDRVV